MNDYTEKINKLEKFYEWLYGRVKSVHRVNESEMYNIMEKL